MKKSRKALLTSALSLLLCFSMLLGTTYAWFTDSVESTNNIIQAGNLDVELEYWDKDAKKWESVGGGTPLFEENTLWEPGYTQVVYLRAANKGTLALKYQLGINIAEEKSGTRVDENGQSVSFKLSDSIYMGVKEGVNGETGAYATREAAVEAVKDASGIISKGFNKYGDMAANDPEQYLAVVVYMPESVGNEANHKTDTDAPKITLGIKLLATQKSAELDSFGSDYDAAAKHPLGDINYSAAKTLTAEQVNDDGTLAEAVTIGNESDGIYAEVPDGVKLADGATALELTVQAMDESNANITTNNGETAASLDVHVEGVHEDNEKPIIINLGAILPAGLNDGNVKLYHVEYDDTLQQDVTNAMTLVTAPVNHNEFSYDPATGEVVVAMAKFSEVLTVTDDNNDWDGTADDYSWYVGQTSPYTISNANQLAAFGRIVDGTASYEDANDNKVEIPADSFSGKTVQLGADITLSGGNSFNPIGCGYAPETGVTNSKDANGNSVPGYAFMGTFDGGIYDTDGELIGQHTISNLYQDGWELGLSYCNLGGGLFASVAGTTEKPATIKNLTISGANIVMECVEMGVLVGLSQGTCKYENINIYGCKIANYQRATGGLIGEVSPLSGSTNETTITNVKIDSNTVVGSLWGDFDCPVGGVIGARWDNAGKDPQIVMNNVAVAARLDVYNDVTSSYQWYAYRRAGMLIGNTDTPPADGKNSKVATADFLTCLPDEKGNDSVVVIYGNWVNYHYCEFSDCNSSWPWVRVEAGEKCSAYSNPRWGVAKDSEGNPITDSLHTHTGDDEHLVLLPFNQLYGGGQGVYGQATHTGVTEGAYTVTYMDHGEVLHVDYVVDNKVAYDQIWDKDNVKDASGATPSYWVDANNNQFTGVDAGNTADVIVYPKWPNEYVVRCIDTKGNVAYYAFFSDTETTDDEFGAIAAAIKHTLEAIQNEVDATGKVITVKWEKTDGTLVTEVSAIDLRNANADVILTATPELVEGSISLDPVYDDTTGELVAYKVTNVVADESNKNVVIPPYVGTVPVTTISAGAAAGFNNLTAVKIPATVESIGSGAFADTSWSSGRQTITIYYEGTSEQWAQYMTEVYTDKNYEHFASDWDNKLGDGSRVFFLDENDNVINTCYWELDADGGFLGIGATYTWLFHNHAFPHDSANHSCEYDHNQNDTPYTDGTRVDYEYWS